MALFGFQSKKKLQERAEDLMSTVRVDVNLANKTDSFEDFMEYYDEILASFKELCEISDKTKLKGISGDFKLDYYRLKNDRQWHMRDALEREYNRIAKDGTTIYRNNRRRTVASCENFRETIRKFSNQFDEETSAFAKDLLKKLALKFNIQSKTEEMSYTSRYTHRDFNSLSGQEFEYWCADLLRKVGFSDVTVTPGSGDQGVDVLASKDGIKYAIQCKHYTNALGNTPIQEVSAGKQFYGCHVGVVMTNSTFTQGAIQLAAATNVLLWDRSKLEELLSMAGGLEDSGAHSDHADFWDIERKDDLDHNFEDNFDAVEDRTVTTNSNRTRKGMRAWSKICLGWSVICFILFVSGLESGDPGSVMMGLGLSLFSLVHGLMFEALAKTEKGDKYISLWGKSLRKPVFVIVCIVIANVLFLGVLGATGGIVVTTP